VKISKRSGSYVTLRDLIEWTSKDAVRFFLISRKADTEFVFDVDLALKQSNENPVYYVQYAHARICSIERKAAEQGVPMPDPETVDLSILGEETELALMRQLADYPENLERFATDESPHGLPRMAMEIAQSFHQFYTQCLVLGDDPQVTAARLALTTATRQVLYNVLKLLGISAPESM
jgi:arginyl-tRNA synthetase